MSLHPRFPNQNTLMTRHIAKRWCVLAENRLAYLTDLFETGRWRRFHNEVEFLENIQEAKDAVARWRAMAAGEIAPASSLRRDDSASRNAITVAALDAAVPAQVEVVPDDPSADDEIAPVLIPIERLLRRAPPRDFARRTAPLPDIEAEPAELNWRTALDQSSIEERYPMLRAAM